MNKTSKDILTVVKWGGAAVGLYVGFWTLYYAYFFGWIWYYQSQGDY